MTEYFSKALDIMLEAGICEPIAAKDVKSISAITLAPKNHVNGMTMEELRQRPNKECEQAGLSPVFDSPPDAPPLPPTDKSGPQKWRVCTNYMQLNETTKVLQLPQGDIRTKQQAVSGH